MWRIHVLGAMVIALLLSACGTGPAGTPAPTVTVHLTESPFTGYPAPDFTLSDTAGRPVALHSYRGHPVWINLWATWCPPCQIEMPEMQQIYTRYQSRGLVILGVDEQEDAASVLAFVQPRALTWPFLLDADGAVARRYYLTGLPLHVFVDAAGVIRATAAGGLDAPTMEADVRLILDAAP